MMRAVRPGTRAALEAHAASGRRFEAGGVASFAREEGPEGAAAVVCVHGVPASSFLWRRVLRELAGQGLRAVALDLPGLGLADRPERFDYSWSGLARWLGEALDALGIERCHLAVHDIGGPIGCEWAVRNPERVVSLTVLNSVMDPASFRRPFPMWPFARPLLGPLWLRALGPAPFAWLFYRLGVANPGAVPRDEVLAHYELLRRGDGGRAFLRIMRGFELTEAKRRLLWEGLARRPYPARVVWGRLDPAIGPGQLEAARRALGDGEALLLDAKHFLQEDHPRQVAEAIAAVAAPLL